MKKGFTLIEMLGIIVILSVVVLITYTGVSTMNRNIREKEFEDYKKTLYMAYETYINQNKIEVYDEMSISVSKLLNENYLDKVVANPVTKEYEYNARVQVKKDQAGVLIFEYIGEEE